MYLSHHLTNLGYMIRNGKIIFLKWPLHVPFVNGEITANPVMSANERQMWNERHIRRTMCVNFFIIIIIIIMIII